METSKQQQRIKRLSPMQQTIVTTASTEAELTTRERKREISELTPNNVPIQTVVESAKQELCERVVLWAEGVVQHKQTA